MNIYEQLRDLEEYLAGEIRQFNDSAKLCDAKGAIKGTYYCVGVSAAYENVRARVRRMVPGRLARDVLG